MKIGDLEIFLVTDGITHVDAGGPFGLVPRALYQKYFMPDELNRIPMILTCMVLRSQGKTILIDTGYGQKLSQMEMSRLGLKRPGGGLIEELAKIGIAPEEIDIVINTHLHGDHCGGNTFRVGETIRPTFPRATTLVQRIEWADFKHPDARTRGTYFEENLVPLWEAGRVQLLHGDTQVTENVCCVATPGHTRGHQSVLLSAGEWKGLFVGDVASYSVLMGRTSWLTAYDIDPLENISTKQRWQKWALENDAWLFFQHDPETPIARLQSLNGRWNVVPVEEAKVLSDSLPTQPQPPG